MNFKKIYLVLSVVAMGAFSACSPDEAGAGTGMTAVDADASFTVAQADANHYTFTATRTPEIMSSRWDFGKTDEVNPTPGTETQSVFFPDAGNYTITHVATGRTGTMTTATQQITVTTSDPNSGNLVRGGKFDSPAAISEWTKLIISGNGNWTFANNKATITASGGGQQGIYQAINVVGGKSYKIDMFVSTAGVTDTWFEVYASKTAPTQNSDYNADGIRMQLNTWAGCGGSALSGWLSEKGCGGSGNIVTFPTSGVMYLVIKCGGTNVPGISITNVEMRGQ